MSRLLLCLFALVALTVVVVDARQGVLSAGDQAPLPGEGAACASGALKGVCTAGACVGGTKLSRKCVGPAAVMCCVMNSGAALGVVPAPAPAPTPAPKPVVVPTKPVAALVPGTPTTPFPYTFPCQETTHKMSCENMWL
jgi:hypothetical protein